MPRGLGIALAALGVIGIVVVLLIVTGSLGSSSPSSSSSSTRASNAPRDHRARAATINPATVTVSVLNGTATNGLAHRLLQRLEGVGYKQGTQGNAPLQTHTTTTVAYLPGFKREARSRGDHAEARSVGGSAGRPEHAVRCVLGPEPLHHERRRYRRRESGEYPLRPEEA